MYFGRILQDIHRELRYLNTLSLPGRRAICPVEHVQRAVLRPVCCPGEERFRVRKSCERHGDFICQRVFGGLNVQGFQLWQQLALHTPHVTVNCVKIASEEE